MAVIENVGGSLCQPAQLVIVRFRAVSFTVRSARGGRGPFGSGFLQGASERGAVGARQNRKDTLGESLARRGVARVVESSPLPVDRHVAGDSQQRLFLARN